MLVFVVKRYSSVSFCLWPQLVFDLYLLNFLHVRIQRGTGVRTIWNINSGYKFPYKFWYGPLEKQLHPDSLGPIASRGRAVRSSVNNKVTSKNVSRTLPPNGIVWIHACYSHIQFKIQKDGVCISTPKPILCTCNYR